jgi:hypothetical protein
VSTLQAGVLGRILTGAFVSVFSYAAIASPVGVEATFTIHDALAQDAQISTNPVSVADSKDFDGPAMDWSAISRQSETISKDYPVVLTTEQPTTIPLPTALSAGLYALGGLGIIRSVSRLRRYFLG